MSGVDPRASDAEREASVARLREASAEGRLPLEELARRTELAYAATTRGELERVTADLPTSAAPAAPAPRRGGRIRWVVGVFAPTRRRGRWRVGERVVVVSVFAPTTLDFREASFEHDEVTVVVVSVFGPTRVVVPPHVDVDVGVVSIFGPLLESGEAGELPPAAPRLRVVGASVFGPVSVRYRRR